MRVLIWKGVSGHMESLQETEGRDNIRLNGFGNSAYLIHLQKHSVASLLLMGFLGLLHVGHEEIITDEFNLACLIEFTPAVPVILGKGVFQKYNGVLADETLVEFGQFAWGYQIR
jgi:hypothetical protein